MIGKLKGIIDSFGDDWVIVDVGGVGYVVTCSSRTLGAMAPVGDTISLAIETYVREDQIRLFGFACELEREWFRLLMTVQGVGTRVALAILSTLSVSDLANAILLQDKATVSRAPGVGPKVAQRIVAELKEKVPAFVPTDSTGADVHTMLAASARTSVTDALSALANLGYVRTQAGTAVSLALKEAGDDASTETIIRIALKELAR